MYSGTPPRASATRGVRSAWWNTGGKKGFHRDPSRPLKKTHPRRDAALGLSNTLVESTKIKIRLLMRQAFGFRDAAALIGLALVSLGGLCPPLPGRPE